MGPNELERRIAQVQEEIDNEPDWVSANGIFQGGSPSEYREPDQDETSPAQRQSLNT